MSISENSQNFETKSFFGITENKELIKLGSFISKEEAQTSHNELLWTFNVEELLDFSKDLNANQVLRDLGNKIFAFHCEGFLVEVGCFDTILEAENVVNEEANDYMFLLNHGHLKSIYFLTLSFLLEERLNS